MLPGLFFGFWRICEIVTLIPIVGMLAWFVDGFTDNNQLTPTFILVLFIVSTLALAWAIGTLFLYARARHSGGFVAFVDLLFVGALIAGVYELRDIAGADCGHFDTSSDSIFLNLGPFGYVGVQADNHLSYHLDKSCSMLKASFAFGIMNIIFFFFTTFLALWVGHHSRSKDTRRRERVVYDTRTRSSRSPRYSSSPRRSHHSHRSSHRQAII